MSDYIAIDNTCPTIKLWQQYRKNDPAVNFFAWLRDYWQDKYFDYVMDEIVPQLSSCNADTEYIQFLATYWYGIVRPVDVTSVLRYDTTLNYDEGAIYDYRADAGVIAREQFKNMIDFILDWTEHDWNIPLLYKMIMGFTGVAGEDITIEQDSTRPDVFLISLPNNNLTLLFRSLIINYASVWNLPFGITLEITIA